MFQFWRESSANPNISTALLPTPSKENEVFYRNVSSDTVLYSVNLNIPVQANDYLGIAQLVVSTMQFLSVENETASNFYFRPLLLSTFNLLEDGINWPFLPLITAVVSRTLVWCTYAQYSYTVRQLTVDTVDNLIWATFEQREEVYGLSMPPRAYWKRRHATPIDTEK